MFTLCNAITQNGQSNLSTQTFNVWDVLSVVVAFIAIIVAVCVAVAQSLSGRKERQAALEAEYFRRIYSEHLLKLISLFELGKEYLGNIDEFNDWLQKPMWGLDEKPIDFLNISGGVDLIIDRLERMAQGYPL